MKYLEETSSNTAPKHIKLMSITAVHSAKYLNTILIHNALLLVTLGNLKLISYAPYCLERPLIGYAFELLTKSLDVNVYRS